MVHNRIKGTCNYENGNTDQTNKKRNIHTDDIRNSASYG